MLGAGDLQQLDRFAVEEDHGAQVDVELKVDVFVLVVRGRGADADTRIVDEHVEAPEALAMTRDDVGDHGGIGEVPRDALDLMPAVAQPLRDRFERVDPAGGDRQAMAFVGEQFGECQPDAAAGSSDDGGAVGHVWHTFRVASGTPRNLVLVAGDG